VTAIQRRVTDGWENSPFCRDGRRDWMIIKLSRVHLYSNFKQATARCYAQEGAVEIKVAMDEDGCS
jgi:allantoicase